MRAFTTSFYLFLALFSQVIHASEVINYDEAPRRIIVLTDIGNEPDDAESMVRFLLYANQFDIEGIVATTSRHLPSNPNPQLIHERIDAYSQVLKNLHQHDSAYPSAEALHSKVFTGSNVYGMKGVGEGKLTKASQLIIDTVDTPDPRPVWVTVWGGAADLAQALWTIRATRSPEALAKFVKKLRVYSISDQDDASSWARAYFPELFWITSVHGFTRYNLATWTGISAPMEGADPAPVSKDWLAKNIQAFGPMGAIYPTPAYIMEGDTPSYLSLIPNGLNVSERPDWGGWGGRYEKLSNLLGLWAAAPDSAIGVDGKKYYNPQASIWRWRWAFQNDFAARIQWSVSKHFNDANHPPKAVLNDKAGLAPVIINACPGEKVILSAKGSSDPDDDSLTYKWWWYRDASGLNAPALELVSERGETAQIVIGDKARVDQFTPPSEYLLHVILEVEDSGTPALISYRRAIIKVPGAKDPDSKDACAVKPVPPSH